MLVAAQSQPVALCVQTPAQRKQVDAFHATVSATPLPVSVPAPVPLSTSIQMQVQVQVQVASPPPQLPQQPVEEPVVVPVHERLLAAQLAHLASQHHASEYSRFKFGQRGEQISSPTMYVPLSLQSPLHIRGLRSQQARFSEQQAWWISGRSGCDLCPEQAVRRDEVQAQHVNADVQTLPTLVTGVPSLDIQHEISAAMASQMPSAHITKTSQSHPINISMVIPAEALPGLASQLVSPSTSSPVLFHLPQDFHLDRVTAIRARGVQGYRPFNRFMHPSCHPAMRAPVPITWAQNGSSELLQNALNGEFGLPPPPRPLFVPSQEPRTVLQPMMLPLPPFAVPGQTPTPPSPPKGVIRRRPRYGRATSAPPAFRTLRGMQRRVSNMREARQGLPRQRSSPEIPTSRFTDVPSVVPSVITSLERDTPDCDTPEDEFSNNGQHGLMLPPDSVTPSPPAQIEPALVSDDTAPEDHIHIRQLGNMYLSSCPGKKVRLSGPVKGRAAICRDLRADLSRVRDLGVECVICCLDDNELEFLGASWAEYSSIANEIGLDVLRIPMPEGLTPLSPALLDDQLQRIIETYTLRGVPVLAHCRGGVGRAGLVACCWMLKLGLCGWKDPEVCARSCTQHAHSHGFSPGPEFERPIFRGQTRSPLRIQTCNNSNTQLPTPSPSPSPTVPLANVPRVCRATVQLLERALLVMRRRRSLKAIETYEQVRFLVDFIEFLDSEGHSDWQFRSN
ncbi:phosphatases II [Fomitiporia mediterranea MF3/22]|uniref:phosphatases II n=1 Tax=Fomitiporia mediterranea (strain MF3/22) TaxID=694068 RepID=UPI0004408310|nr:phosphatases II [Fomitiporia mediterranea MF3/22]EJD03254.1 phosphatases II [Fomitiporia mediterranea MF3/22]